MSVTAAVPDTVAEPADLPDFDCYPIRHRLISARAVGRSVAVRWDDGLDCRYHVFWLRENAPDAETTHPVTREQALHLLDIPEDLAAADAGVDGAGGLWVRWSTGEQSRFHPGWLRSCSAEAPDDLHALAGRRIWEADAPVGVPRFSGPAVLDDPVEEARWCEALHVYGVALLEGLDVNPAVIETVPARLGPIRDTNFGRIFEVSSRPDADSNAYTAMHLPPHTDLATREYEPGLQFLHCLENSAVGGDSILADGFAIARVIAETDPEAYDALTAVPLAFANKARNTDYRQAAPMFRLDADGRVDEVRWSPWLRAPLRADFDTVDRVYRGLRLAFALAESPALRLRLRLRPGELLGFDNRRVLHGRTGFDPATGRRHLRGCYVEREELHSRLRILARQRRHAGSG